MQTSPYNARIGQSVSTVLNPPTPQHRAQGRAILQRFQAGDFDAAERLCRELLAARPDDAALQGLMGSIKAAQGEHRAALTCFDAAYEAGLDDCNLHLNRGLAAKRLDLLEQAQTAFARALELDPERYDARFELGNVHRLSGDLAAAGRHYRAVIRQAPGFAEAHAALALVHEQQHQLEAAEAAAQAAIMRDAHNVTAGLVLARVALRRHQPEAARRSLQALTAQDRLTPQNHALACNLLGQVHEQLHEYEAAFEQFTAAKAALRALYDAKAVTGISIYSPRSIHAMHDFFQRHPVHKWPRFAPEAPLQLAFLVGFPRSGTTLMDQILASHPHIQTIEEQPTLADGMQDLLSSPEAMARLPALGDAEIGHYRKKYLQRARNYLPSGYAGLIVDKLPLNTVVLGLVWRLFPEARVIWAIRDPRAVVLSCFKQNFGPNDAMAPMLSLESIAEYYAAVMALGVMFQETLPLKQHRIKYEDLVDDLEGESRQLLEFLGLAWHPGVLNYQETARRRRINTPSYQQVVRPIYKSSKARWRDYTEQLKPVMPVLEPYIKYYGYRIDSDM